MNLHFRSSASRVSCKRKKSVCERAANFVSFVCLFSKMFLTSKNQFVCHIWNRSVIRYLCLTSHAINVIACTDKQRDFRLKKKFCVSKLSKLPPAFVFLCAFDFAKFRLSFFFSWNYYFFHFYYEKRRKFAVLEEYKHVGAQKTCKIPFDF